MDICTPASFAIAILACFIWVDRALVVVNISADHLPSRCQLSDDYLIWQRVILPYFMGPADTM